MVMSCFLAVVAPTGQVRLIQMNHVSESSVTWSQALSERTNMAEFMVC